MGGCCKKEMLQSEINLENDQQKQEKVEQVVQNQIPVRQSLFVPDYNAMSPKTQAKYQPIQVQKADGRNQSVFQPNFDVNSQVRQSRVSIMK